MADTNYGVNHSLTVKVWAKKLFQDSLKQTIAHKFMGSNANAIISMQDELSKGAGDRVRVGLRLQLSGDGVSGDDTLEGNEEALVTHSDDLLIDQLRNAVVSKGKMSEQRIPFSVREESRAGLVDWWADRIDTGFFNQIAGNTAQTDTKFTGMNAVSTFDSNHVVYPDGDTSEAQVSSSSTSSKMTLSWIDYCVERAETLDIPIRPFIINGEKKFAMFLHPFQVTDLRQNTNSGQWLDIQKAAMQGGQISKNPIFTGALGEYNNVILFKSTRVPLAPTFTDVYRAIFCGAQSVIMSVGQDNKQSRMTWKEELFDYGNSLGVSAGMIYGMKKTRFNGEDFGTIVLPTYAVAHST